MDWEEVMSPECQKTLRCVILSRRKRLKHHRQTFEDELHDTMVRLVKCNKPYDPSRGTKRSTWMNSVVRWAHNDAMLENGSYVRMRVGNERERRRQAVNSMMVGTVYAKPVEYEDLTEYQEEAKAHLQDMSDEMASYVALRMNGIGTTVAQKASGIRAIELKEDFLPMFSRCFGYCRKR